MIKINEENGDIIINNNIIINKNMSINDFKNKSDIFDTVERDMDKEKERAIIYYKNNLYINNIKVNLTIFISNLTNSFYIVIDSFLTNNKNNINYSNRLEQEKEILKSMIDSDKKNKIYNNNDDNNSIIIPYNWGKISIPINYDKFYGKEIGGIEIHYGI